MTTRRTFLAALAAAAIRGAEPLPLIDDTRFERGLSVLKATAGVRIPAGDIAPFGATRKPVWTAAQWYSHFNLAEAKRVRLPTGSSRFFDGAKEVTFGAASSREADIILALNGRKEYGDRAPAAGEPWPHLLVEQNLTNRPKMVDVQSIPFGIEYRLLKSQAFHLPGWDDQRHTAQFLLYVTIQNGNHASQGFGDYFWFGVPMYDARSPLPRRFTAPDNGSALKVGTGKYIFLPDGKQYTTRPAKDGAWVRIHRDLLPLMREGLETAWQAGYLQDSHRPEDYELSGMNMGWEVTGPLNVAMQVRGLTLTAVSKL